MNSVTEDQIIALTPAATEPRWDDRTKIIHPKERFRLQCKQYEEQYPVKHQQSLA